MLENTTFVSKLNESIKKIQKILEQEIEIL
jgi:hypothetical protein